MPLNDYWNNILSAQGRGWGQWRAPSEMERTPEWSRARGGVGWNGWGNGRGGGGWGNTPSSSSFIAQTGQGFAQPIGQGGNAPVYPNLQPMPMPDGMTTGPVAPGFGPPMGGGVMNPNAPTFTPPMGGGVVNPNAPMVNPFAPPPGGGVVNPNRMTINGPRFGNLSMLGTI